MNEKSPLAMLAKACETIGCNASNEPSPKKSKSSANGTSKAVTHQSTKQSINGVNHSINYNADINGKLGDGANVNGKHVKKENGNNAPQNRKGSPRTNGVNANPAISCEPSTSSPLTTMPNGQMPLPFGIHPNPAMFPANFPAGLMQRFQAPNGMPGAAPGGHPQAAFPGMPPMSMPPGFAAGGAPFNFQAMAAMAAAFGGAQPAQGVPGMPSQNVAMMMPGAPMAAMRPANPATSAATMPAVSQAMPSTPPAVNANQKRPVPNTPTSTGVQNGQLAAPIPNPMQMPMQGHEAEAFFAAMAAQQQMAAMFGANPYGFPPIFGMPHMMGPSAMVSPQSQIPMPTDNMMSATAAAQASANSLQSLLMAAASGQQPRFTCNYGINKNGQTCGKTFDTDLELFAHFRQHLQAIVIQTTSNGTPAVSSPSQTVSSTTTEPTVSTASSAPPSTNAASAMTGTPQQNGGGKMKAGTGSLKHSPVSAAPSPKQQQSANAQTVLPNNGMIWNPMPSPLQCPPPVSSAAPQLPPNNRFHPYANAMPKQMPPGIQVPPVMTPQQQQQMMQHMQAQYEFTAMAAAAAASGLPFPGMGMHNMPYGPLMGPPPHMMHHPGVVVSAHQPQTIAVSAPEKGN